MGVRLRLGVRVLLTSESEEEKRGRRCPCVVWVLYGPGLWMMLMPTFREPLALFLVMLVIGGLGFRVWFAGAGVIGSEVCEFPFML